jgi:non-ribosomal peptide synthetase component E (peptide arylation enzyme)
LKPGQDIAPDDIAKALRATLANYKIPKQVFILNELPMLPIGKVDKKALKTQSAELAP